LTPPPPSNSALPMTNRPAILCFIPDKRDQLAFRRPILLRFVAEPRRRINFPLAIMIIAPAVHSHRNEHA
jgi:hypothetical protein